MRVVIFSNSQELSRYDFIESPLYKYKRVCRRVLLKLKIRRAIGILNDDILVYGTSYDLLDINQNYKQKIDMILENKRLSIENVHRVTTKDLSFRKKNEQISISN